jgi:hypothetical protein
MIEKFAAARGNLLANFSIITLACLEISGARSKLLVRGDF